MNSITLNPDMLDSILAVACAADKDRTSPVLSCVCIRITDSELAIVATNGKILVEHTYEYDTSLLDFNGGGLARLSY